MIKIFNKLVRDKIPEIIKTDNQEPCIKILDKEEYKKELLKKIVEEAKEVEVTNNNEDLIKEIGDVLEVIDAIVVANSLDVKEIERIKKIRLEKRGGFKKRIFLEKVI